MSSSNKQVLLAKSNKDGVTANTSTQINNNRCINRNFKRLSSTRKGESDKRPNSKCKSKSDFKVENLVRARSISTRHFRTFSDTSKQTLARSTRIHSSTTPNTFNKKDSTVHILTTTPMLRKAVAVHAVCNKNWRTLQKATPTLYKAPKETSVGRQNLNTNKKYVKQVDFIPSRCTLFFCLGSLNSTHHNLNMAQKQQAFTQLKDNLLLNDRLITYLDASAKISVTPRYTGDIAFFVAFLVILMITRSFRFQL